MPVLQGKKAGKSKKPKFIFSGSGEAELLAPDIASYQYLNGKCTNSADLIENCQLKRYFDDLPLVVSTWSCTYCKAVAYTNTVHVHSKGNNMTTNTEFGLRHPHITVAVTE